MPLVGTVAAATSTLGTTTSYSTAIDGSVCTFVANVVLPPRDPWWHSTVHVTSGNFSASTTQRAKDLTTVYTYATECKERWMLSPLPVCANTGFGATALGNRTVFSIDPAKSIVNDPMYKSCQPYSTPTYSPGVCPDRHTVAEVTAYQSNVSTGFRTFWQASCCKSGMTVGPEYPLACISYIATPLVAYDLPSTYNSTARLPAAATVSSAQPGSTSDAPQASATTSKAVTITSGVAIADPIVVAWQVEDLTLFPTGYTKSLAEMGLTTASKAPGNESATIDAQARDRNEGLSTGAKTGLGVGIALGLVAVGALMGFWLIKRRRKHATTSREPVIPEMEDQDQEQAGRKWFFGGKWRNEINAEQEQNELDSKTVHIVPGPPAELDGCSPGVRTEDEDGRLH